MLVSCAQMQEAEAAAFAKGVSAGGIMLKVGRAMADTLVQRFPSPGTAVLYLGKGNNAGDALVVGIELAKLGWKILGRFSGDPSQLKPLPTEHLHTLDDDLSVLHSPPDLVEARRPILLIDGLLGIGAVGPMRSAVAELTAEINHLRKADHAQVIALDLPSGVDGNTGIPAPDAVEADITLTVGQIKKGLVEDTAIHHVGRLQVISVAELSDCAGDTAAAVLTPELLRPWMPRRAFDTHKGQAGRVAIIAGSRGLTGAADLASNAAVRGGAGLVTLHVPQEIYPILAARTAPEIMVRPERDLREVLDRPCDVIVIGPGIGFEQKDAVLHLLKVVTCPMIVDADALTILANSGSLPGLLTSPAGPRLLTPHPGEMARLVAAHEPTPHPTRRAQAETFVAEWGQPNVTLLLKGARTLIATIGQPTLFNSTGHPGMASGGMGDVLSGLLGALIGQGIPLHQAAGLGAWLSGRAAELAAQARHHEIGIAASDLPRHFGEALAEIG
ncbi:MAG: NAD(P)H-hydrate dehydratase [Verrucomicrobiales bacterium]|nr:NAD(P)H-hydrate dehydratase [Verrucomicrobiales bacterium]MCP5556940.1 NAD(P)H-hydrate dehydratase [Verrucomicrobiaceae bacterium]